MDRELILATLRAHQPELIAAGLLHLRLFGSVARGDNTPDSDVDLLFNFDESRRLNVLKAYRVEDDLTQMLGRRTHLSSAIHLKPKIQAHVLAECIDVY